MSQRSQFGVAVCTNLYAASNVIYDCKLFITSDSRAVLHASVRHVTNKTHVCCRLLHRNMRLCMQCAYYEACWCPCVTVKYAWGCIHGNLLSTLDVARAMQSSRVLSRLFIQCRSGKAVTPTAPSANNAASFIHLLSHSACYLANACMRDMCM